MYFSVLGNQKANRLHLNAETNIIIYDAQFEILGINQNHLIVFTD